MPQRNAINVMNSVEAHILQNGQILLSYVDISDMRSLWHHAEQAWADEAETENSLYTIAQAFIFSLAVKILYSGEILIE